METTAAVLALAALAQDSRLAIFRLLVQTGPQGLAAGRIAEVLAFLTENCCGGAPCGPNAIPDRACPEGQGGLGRDLASQPESSP